MTFHSDLVTDAVWPADIRTALSLTAGVYVGRRLQNVARKDVEVLILRNEVETGVGGSLEPLDVHEYELQVRTRAYTGR